jgi:plastocyanin
VIRYLILALLLGHGRSLSPPSAAAELTGSVSGVVQVARTPARRVAERYAGGTPAVVRTVQPVAAVVYLKGGTRSGGSSSRPVLLQRDTAFVPGALAVEVGTTVLFPNGDPFFHNVFSYSKPKRFDLGRYPQGEAKAVRFDTPGVVKIYCEVHASMRALIVVTENPWHAVVDEDGRFTIRDVPPGRYELVVVDADRGQRTSRVTVTAGAATRVSVALP